MIKISLKLPKYRLDLRARLVKRRVSDVSEPILPTLAIVKRKYRSGTLIGKAVRYFSEHKLTKKLFFGNMAFFVIAGTMLPGTQAYSYQNDTFFGTEDEAVIQAETSIKTVKAIQVPLSVYKVNQGYGIFHPGVDLGTEIGAKIEPIKAGEVIEAGYSKDGYGNTVLIDHEKGLTSRYAHLSKIEVSVGQTVTTEDEIGQVGTTGRSTGPHLHLEIRQNEVPLNPLSVLPR